MDSPRFRRPRCRLSVVVSGDCPAHSDAAKRVRVLDRSLEVATTDVVEVHVDILRRSFGELAFYVAIFVI